MTALQSPSQTPERRSLESLVGSLVNVVTKELSSGDRADLRRVSQDDFGGPAFWKIAATQLVPSGRIVPTGSLRDQQERQWLTILSAIAQLEGLHAPGRRLGEALADSGFSELRLNRLLRAEGRGLLYQVRQMVQFLASKGAPVSLTDIARLVLSDATSSRPRVRREIASHYYGSLFAQSAKE